MSIEKLEKMGFKNNGRFFLNENQLDFLLENFSSEKGVYVFELDGEILYIGETALGLRRRMYGYKNPGSDQQTNKRINKKMIEELQGGREIIIRFITQNAISLIDVILKKGNIELDVKTSSKLLERFLIDSLRPKWNLK